MAIDLHRIHGGHVPVSNSPHYSGLPMKIVKAHDGAPLAVYDIGPRDAECIVFCLPLSVPANSLKCLFTQLSLRFRLVTWDTRGYPSINDNFSQTDNSPKTHLSDLFSVINGLGISRAHLVGYCVGARLAARACLERPDIIKKLVLLCGRFILPDLDSTHFSQGAAFFSAPARSYASAAIVSRQLCSLFQSEFYNSMFSGIDSVDQFRECIIHPFTTTEYTHRYARMIVEVLGDGPDNWIEGINKETLLLSFQDDKLVRLTFAEYTHRRIRNSRFIVYPEGGHYSIYKASRISEVCSDIVKFLSSK